MFRQNGFRADEAGLFIAGAGNCKAAGRAAALFQFQGGKQGGGERTFVIRHAEPVIKAVILKANPKGIGHFGNPDGVDVCKTGKKRRFGIAAVRRKLPDHGRASGNRLDATGSDSVFCGKRAEKSGDARLSRQIIALSDAARIDARKSYKFFQQVKSIHRKSPFPVKIARKNGLCKRNRRKKTTESAKNSRRKRRSSCERRPCHGSSIPLSSGGLP